MPSFARQTGLDCTACHTAYPQLNAFGRSFKMHGYILGGGDSKFPPFALFLQPSFTHTGAGQPGGAAPRFSNNNNFALSQASLFFGGKIYGNFGGFSQFTYSGVDNAASIDNTDLRWADEFDIGDNDLLLGVTLNNNPTVQDPWNTTPAWGYPFAGSDLAPGPAAGTLIDGGVEMQVAGLGAYTLFDDTVYAEITGYKTLSADLQGALGVDPTDEDQLRGIMPYWRLALQHEFGNHYVSVGTFGLLGKTYPGRDKSQGTDTRRDIGLDATYQYSGDKSDVTVLLRYINEQANWDAGYALGNTDNPKDHLNTFSATLSYLYDKTYGVDLNYSAIRGSADAALYGSRTGSPDTDSFTVQLDYLPFNRDGGPSFWPWFNPKFALQYTAYTKFDGSKHNYDGEGRSASDNNTVYLVAWMPF